MWLLVEDDTDIRIVVATMMAVWGENPLPFPDGKTAWAWLDSVEDGTFSGPLPDLALMDIRMPGYTGDQLAARMRTIERLKDIPIILMTAFSMSDAEIAALRERCGIDHLLEKPLPDLDAFRTLLYKVRDERRESKIRLPAELEPAVPSAPAISAAPSPQTPPHTPPSDAAPAPEAPAPLPESAIAPPPPESSAPQPAASPEAPTVPQTPPLQTEP
ncbi:MAG: response regulator [Anaerolineae bacterium]|nr:response regulator [Anaerolineae bacterium]